MADDNTCLDCGRWLTYCPRCAPARPSLDVQAVADKLVGALMAEYALATMASEKARRVIADELRRALALDKQI